MRPSADASIAVLPQHALRQIGCGTVSGGVGLLDVDQHAVLAAFDEQIRRRPELDGPETRVEREDGVVRLISSGHGWSGVTWSDLEPASADAVIAAQVSRFAQLSRPWEWKYYSSDQPPDLPARLIAAGLRPEPIEALLVAEISELPLDVPPPPGVQLLPVVDERGVEMLVRVWHAAFGGDHPGFSATWLTRLAQHPDAGAAVVAVAAGQTPIAGGRMEFHHGTDFASLWGGGTVPAWRSRGVFRSLVAHRAALAAARGFRYLQVDASSDSRPILRRLGFVELATTTPFTHPVAGGRSG